MKPDKFKRRFRSSRVDDRTRRQIATEAARRMLAWLGAEAALRTATEADYYAAKRKAAAVLGHTVRPGDLPSDAEVREQVLALERQGTAPPDARLEPDETDAPRLAEHLDRFALYRMRLLPLEAVKQDSRSHPEGDALYHSLQVFRLARSVRPYDEEFLLAALLHDVGKAIDPRAPAAAGLEALRGTLTHRTAWLIEHLPDLSPRAGRALSPRDRKALEESEYYEDLALLRELDEAGRAVGAVVGSIDEALAYLRDLDAERYLDEGDETMIGAIAGDIIGSIYEGRFVATIDFPLFDEQCRFTDDSVLSCAIAEHLLDGAELAGLFQDYYRSYPDAGYGGTFRRWAEAGRADPYQSFGNGSAMRVSPVGFFYPSLDEVLEHAGRTAAVTHNHPEGIKGAQAVAAAVYLARTGASKETIARYVAETFGYDLARSLDEWRALRTFDVTCQGTVPQALRAFLDSRDYEDAIRKAISIGGDSDTLACMAGGIAQAYYGGVPRPIVERVFTILDERLALVARRFGAATGTL